MPAGTAAEAVFEGVFVDHAGAHGQMLPFALGIGEAQIDPLDVIILDPGDDILRLGGHGHFFLFANSTGWTGVC